MPGAVSSGAGAAGAVDGGEDGAGASLVGTASCSGAPGAPTVCDAAAPQPVSTKLMNPILKRAIMVPRLPRGGRQPGLSHAGRSLSIAAVRQPALVPAAGRCHTRAMLKLALYLTVCIVVFLAGVPPLLAHPIDEVKANTVVDLRTTDQRTFALSLYFERRHLQEYTRIVRELGLPVERDREELARNMRNAFTFAPCVTQPRQIGPRFSDAADGAFVGLHFDLVCPQRMENLTLTRTAWRQHKTRTTLYVKLQVRDAEPLQVLIPPNTAAMTLPLTAAGSVLARPEGARIRPQPRDTAQGALPSDPRPIADFPPLDVRQRSWQAPPRAILMAWSLEGVLHLLLGPDHLLFLLTLVIGASRSRTLLFGVTAFSTGHLTAMTAALLLAWPPVPGLDIVIGGTIAFSAWKARAIERQPEAKVAALALGFGLIHGLGFGAGLQALTGGVDNVWWPLLSFGLGLDLAQTAWVLLGWGVWQVLRSQVAPRIGALGAARLQVFASALLLCCGLGAAAFAAWPGL